MKTKMAIGAALAGAALLGALAVAYSSAQPGAQSKSPNKNDAFDRAEEEAIKAIVRDYLTEHPEVLVDSLRAYSEREQANAEAQAKEHAKTYLAQLLDEKNGFAAGANMAAARVAVIELFDYHCGFCKRAAPLVMDLTKNDPQVKVVFRELPILREESDFAAEAALAARAQGKYVAFHFAMMDAQGVLTRERVKQIAQSKGVDFAALEKAAADPSTKAAIEETHKIAGEMAIDGTPTFIVAALYGDFIEIVPGFRQDDLIAAIEAAKKVANAAPAKK